MTDTIDEFVATFRRDGFAQGGEMLGTDETVVLARLIDALCAGELALPEACIRRHGDLPGDLPARDRVWQLLDAHEHHAALRALCEHPRIRRRAEAVLTGPSRIRTTQVIMKPAGHGAAVPWHQDTSYWGAAEVVTCWLAIDDATPENGCMRMIPGSHLSGQLAYAPLTIPGIGVELRESCAVEAERQVWVPVRAGHASFHHPGTLHASDANRSTRRRRAIAITWISDR
ncbi:MAG: phytanoyl-CoA dioxygenase family protein [Planctomycetes bacterium]|nr:phytanoyl-CoA dioxygenase family protein [Planctomycetota bacterium]